ncbi:MAG: hypothetical protein IJ088_16385 [Clostridia bacterium]|nr:hypothetical protein [Clostridia bacterium]
MNLQLSSENIVLACQKAEEFLKGNKVDSRNIIRLQISLEEVLVRYQTEFGSETMF